MTPRYHRLAYALFFLSGATALVYETVWARRLTLTFGASHEAVSVVLAAFMSGLALGGFLFGALARRSRRPLRLYAMVELALAATAALTPWLHARTDEIYVAAALDAAGSPPSLRVLRVALAFAVLLPPTVLMGGTLPILVRFLVHRPSDLSPRLSGLYAVNTAGAVAGTVLASFWLLPVLGMGRTLLAAVAVNLGLGLAALAAARRLTAPLPPPSPPPPGVPAGGEAPSGPRLIAWLAFWGAGVSGGAALALEVLWMRGITVAAGNTAYSFAVMLAAFLAGITLGSWLHGRLLGRFAPARLFGLLLVGVGVTSALVTQAIPRLPELALAANRLLYDRPGGVRAGATLLLSFAVMLVPCTLLGAAFPAAGRAAARLHDSFAVSIGRLVACNTGGAVLGAMAAGFVLVPRLGLQRGMLAVAAVCATYGVLLTGLASGVPAARGARLRRLAALAGVGVVAAVSLPLLPAWDLRPLAVFRNNSLSGAASLDLGDVLARSSVLYYREGVGANVSVAEGTRARALIIDGKAVATDGVSDMQHELLLGHVPVLLHPAPRSVAVVGLGAGITLGATLAHPQPERALVIEIEPAVVDAARLFAHVNGGALDDPRLEVALQDGRNYLLTTGERFDVITADPIHPWARGAAYLYTREYYALAAERLRPGGLMCQWLPLYELSLENVRSAIATFAAVFPHTQVWQTANDAILIGGRAPIVVDPGALEARLAEPAVARQLAQLGLADPRSFLAELTLAGDAVEHLAAGAPLNTDDNLYLEFSSPLSVARSDVRAIFAALDDARVTFDRLLPESPAARAWRADAARYREAKRRSIAGQLALQRAEAAPSAVAYRELIAQLREAAAAAPDYGRIRSVLAEAYVGLAFQQLDAGHEATALAALETAVATLPESAAAHHHLATRLSDAGRPADALPHFAAALAARPGYPAARLNLGVSLLRLGRPAEALPHLDAAVALRPTDAASHLMRATAHAQLADVPAAAADFARAEALDPALPGLHLNLAAFLRGLGRTAEARRALQRGLRLHPDDPALGAALAALEPPRQP